MYDIFFYSKLGSLVECRVKLEELERVSPNLRYSDLVVNPKFLSHVSDTCGTRVSTAAKPISRLFSTSEFIPQPLSAMARTGPCGPESAEACRVDC